MDYNKANANGIFKVVIVENATHCQEKILKDTTVPAKM